MGWIIAAAVIVLIALIPLGVSGKYDDEGLLVKVIAGPVRLTVFPLPEKKEEKPKKKKSSGKKKPAAKPKQEPEKKPGKLSDFLPLVKIGLKMLNDLRKKLRVNRLDVALVLAGDDPCDLAVNYGKTWTAVGNLMPRLERFLKIKKRDIRVECDFAGDVTRVYARMDVTITLGRLIWLGVKYGIPAVKEILTITKGGAEK